MKEAKDILAKLVDDAYLEGTIYTGREREYRFKQSSNAVGARITRLSEEDREILSSLKSEDIKNIRWNK